MRSATSVVGRYAITSHPSQARQRWTARRRWLQGYPARWHLTRTPRQKPRMRTSRRNRGLLVSCCSPDGRMDLRGTEPPVMVRSPLGYFFRFLFFGLTVLIRPELAAIEAINSGSLYPSPSLQLIPQEGACVNDPEPTVAVGQPRATFRLSRESWFTDRHGAPQRSITSWCIAQSWTASCATMSG